MQKRYKIADIVAEFGYSREFTEKFFKDYEYYGDEPTQIVASVTESDVRAENIPNVSFNYDINENVAVLRKFSEIAAEKYNALLFHCSSVKYENKGFLFTAPSGTGKSTHVKLLKQLLGDDLTYINDDKPFVRVIDGKIYVYGSPWSGKHRRGNNIRAELKAITILLRGETNKVEKIDPADALDVLFRQTYRPEGETAALNAADILTDMLDNCDFYKLWCNISEEAAKTSFRYILKEESDEN